jgi:hypothetical protein
VSPENERRRVSSERKKKVAATRCTDFHVKLRGVNVGTKLYMSVCARYVCRVRVCVACVANMAVACNCVVAMTRVCVQPRSDV